MFRIPIDAIANLVPKPLVVSTGADGRAHIEVGYARFRASHACPPLQELSWGIGVERQIGRGMAFYCPSLGSDSLEFLDYNTRVGFTTHAPPLTFTTNFDRRSFEASDSSGVICVLRHQPEGSVRIPELLKPLLLGPTEVWTGDSTRLQRRVFKWRGVAKVHLASPVASSLYDHPFFRGARVSRAEPVPYEQFCSLKNADATQLFTLPETARWAGARLLAPT